MYGTCAHMPWQSIPQSKASNMTTFQDLPAAALRLVDHGARTRHIPGTNKYARICRSWRDAAMHWDADEQLQLLLPLEGLSSDTVTSTSQWLSQHGQCVTALHITYDPATGPLFQQLLLSTNSLLGLAQLEVDCADSLVAVAPALPQLVALTHLGASISMDDRNGSLRGVFLAQGVPLEEPPILQQLCPGLKSLQLVIHCTRRGIYHHSVGAPVAELLPCKLEQLHLMGSGAGVGLSCATLTGFTALRCLSLSSFHAADPNLLLHMPGFKQLELRESLWSGEGHPAWDTSQFWLTSGRSGPAQQHLTKLKGVDICLEDLIVGEQFDLQWPLLSRKLVKMHTLAIQRWEVDDTAWVQDLSGFAQLRSLTLDTPYTPDETEAVLAALSSVQQLTHLGLLFEPAREMRSTWAALLPHLSQLRVLCVHKELLLGRGLAPELMRLTQLQCLYVRCHVRRWDPAASGAEVAALLEVLSTCSSLRAVLCWPYAERFPGISMWGAVHEGKLHLNSWHGWGQASEEGRVVCPQRCPHLPGVWELRGQPADGLSSD